MSLDYIDPNTSPPPDWSDAIFPEPMLYRLAPLWVFLLVLALLGLVFYRQRLMDARSDGLRAPSIIFREVRSAIDRALWATGAATIPAGQKVIETMRLYLGPILALSADLKGPYGKLEDAVAGKAEHEKPHKDHDPHETEKSDAKRSTLVVTTPGHDGAITTEKLIQVLGPAQVVTVTEAPQPHHHGGHEGHHEAMSTHEQTAAVRYALERLHEYWTINTVEPRLRAIHDALSIREPKGARLSREPLRSRPAEVRRRSPQAAEVKAKI